MSHSTVKQHLATARSKVGEEDMDTVIERSDFVAAIEARAPA